MIEEATTITETITIKEIPGGEEVEEIEITMNREIREEAVVEAGKIGITNKKSSIIFGTIQMKNQKIIIVINGMIMNEMMKNQNNLTSQTR